MNQRELENAYTELQKEVFRLRAENDALRHGQRWYDIAGSSWEAQQTQARASTAVADLADPQPELIEEGQAYNVLIGQLKSRLRNFEANERLVKAGYRQIKYELYCATVDLLGFSLHVTQERNCLVTSVYGLKTGETEFEFIYDQQQHRYVDLLWSEKLADYAALYQYWIQENRCIQGFLAAVFLEKFNNKGPPPPRERRCV